MLLTYNKIQEISIEDTTISEEPLISGPLEQIELQAQQETNAYSRLLEHIKINYCSQVNLSKQTVKETLLLLNNSEMVSPETDILQFWKIKLNGCKDKYLILLIQTVLAVPTTQVSVERAFSALGLFLTKTRTRLSDKNLENSLLVKLNFDIVKRKTDFEEFNSET